MERSTVAALERAVTRFGDRRAVRTRSTAWLTWADVARRVERARAGLATLGIGPGDEVAVMLPNGVDTLVLWLALNGLGAAPALVSTSYRGDLLEAALTGGSDAEVLVVDQAYAARVADLGPRLSRYRHVVVAGLDAAPESPLAGRSASTLGAVLAADATGAPRAHRPALGDLCVILPTSGTTGPTKGVRIAHNHALHYAEVANAMRRLDENDVLWAHTPLFHADGLFAGLLAAMVAGASLLLVPTFNPYRFWTDVQGFGITSFAYAGSMVATLWREAAPPAGLSHRLRTAYGAPSPGHLARAFENRFGVRMREGYGSTELGIPTMAPWNDSRVEGGSAGLAVCGYDVRVTDASGNPLACGHLGGIRVRPHVRSTAMLGYHGRPDLDGRVWDGDWFRTGDLGRFDADGHLYFAGREADVIRHAGENIAAAEVEAVVCRFAGVVEAVAFGVPSPHGEEEVMVCVRTEGPPIDPRALCAFVRRHLPPHMAPRYVETISEFDRSPGTGKVRRRPLAHRGVSSSTWDARAHRPRRRPDEAPPTSR